MENNQEFFDNLNKNISDAKTRKTLKILEKQGRKYITHIPDSTAPKLVKECKREFNESLKLIKKQYKKVK